jgi:hypothetical protein
MICPPNPLLPKMLVPQAPVLPDISPVEQHHFRQPTRQTRVHSLLQRRVLAASKAVDGSSGKGRFMVRPETSELIPFGEQLLQRFVEGPLLVWGA